jgi:protein SCO1/2
MRRPQLNALLIGGLIAALVAGIGLSHWLGQGVSSDYPAGLVLEPAREIPDFALQNQHGGAYDKSTFAGHWQLLFFGFTQCPDVCPATLAQMQQLKRDLPEDVRKQMDFVLVSVDPARDTPEVLTRYLAYFDPEFLGVTAPEPALESFAASLGVAYIKVGDGENYSMDHSTALVLMNAQGQIKAYFSAPHDLPALQRTLLQLVSA